MDHLNWFIAARRIVTEKIELLSNRFLIQKIAANDPEKKMPSTAAKAMIRSPNVACKKDVDKNV